jgi:hypothetical protein
MHADDRLRVPIFTSTIKKVGTALVRLAHPYVICTEL